MADFSIDKKRHSLGRYMARIITLPFEKRAGETGHGQDTTYNVPPPQHNPTCR